MTKDNPYLDYFDDPERVKGYMAGPPKFVPGFFALHRMACVLMSEHTPQDAHILVHGAGGGLELESFARFNDCWRFLGVDPSLPMLEEARQHLGPLNKRITLLNGVIDDVAEKEFDAATSMLTLHVLDAAERKRTVSEIVRRLKPGAPFIAVHCSFPQAEKETWLNRHRNYTVASGVDLKTAEEGRMTIADVLPILSPQEDEAILQAVGLKNVSQFFAAFTWRGWIGYA